MCSSTMKALLTLPGCRANCLFDGSAARTSVTRQPLSAEGSCRLLHDVCPAGMDPGARHFLWGILQRQVIAAGGQLASKCNLASSSPRAVLRCRDALPMRSRSCRRWVALRYSATWQPAYGIHLLAYLQRLSGTVLQARARCLRAPATSMTCLEEG